MIKRKCGFCGKSLKERKEDFKTSILNPKTNECIVVKGVKDYICSDKKCEYGFLPFEEEKRITNQVERERMTLNFTEANKRKQDIKKFEQVFLYVLSKVGGQLNIGETVLHKLMYFIDFDYLEKYDKYLTGVDYKKNNHGPTFDSQILDKMINAQLIKKEQVVYHNKNQTKYLALKEPNLKGISAQEIKHIDDTLAKHSNKSAAEIEEHSHRDMPWKATKDKETIPYEAVYYRDDDFSVRNYDDDPI